MKPRRWPWLILPVVQMGLIVASWMFSVWSVEPGMTYWSAMAGPVAFGVVTLSFPIVGAVVVWRVPEHPIGRLLTVISSGWALANVASSYADWAGEATSPLIEWLSGGSWTIVVGQGILVVVLLRFPTGSSGSWRWAERLTVWWTVATALATAFAAVPVGMGFQTMNPLAAPGALGRVLEIMSEIGASALPILLLLAVARLIVRHGRASGIERIQIKWILTSTVLALLLLTGVVILPAIFARSADSFPPWVDSLFVIGALSVGLIPVAMGVAILRYRLFDIDRVVSRTVSWGVITMLLVALYGGSVFALRAVLPFQGEIPVAASTLAVAALFAPIRSRVQVAVDRRFDRAKYDSLATIDRFGHELRHEHGLEAVLDTLCATSVRILSPATLSMTLIVRTGEPR